MDGRCMGEKENGGGDNGEQGDIDSTQQSAGWRGPLGRAAEES